MQFYYTIIIKSVIICEKKRGDYMKIDWKLFDDKETIIEKKDKLVKYEDGVIYYKESEINPKYYVMNIEVFYSKYMKLSNYEEYARDIKSR